MEIQEIEKKPMENVWRIPFLQIVWSFILTTITINFYGLQYILPAVGVMLLLIGVHSLKQINQNFYSLWYLAIERAVLFIINLLILSSPLSLHKPVIGCLSILSLILQIAMYLVLRTSIRSVYGDHANKVKRDPLLWASRLMVVTGFVSWMSYDLGVLFALLFFIIFLTIMSSLYKISEELYTIAPNAPVETNKKFDKIVYVIFTLICFLSVGVAGVVSNHTVVEFVEQTELKEHAMREELIQLGFPKEILDDMSDANVELLTGAIHVEVREDVMSFDEKTSLISSTVFTELPDNLMYVVVYFQWNQNKAIWNDGFRIWGEDGFTLIDGNLLCEQKGKDVIAPINRLSCGTVTTSSMFFGEQQSRQITGTICFPFHSKHQRGYVFYKMQLPEDYWLGSNCMNYVHFSQPIQLPFAYADQRILSGTCEVKQHYVIFYLQQYRESYPDSDDWKMPWD